MNLQNTVHKLNTSTDALTVLKFYRKAGSRWIFFKNIIMLKKSAGRQGFCLLFVFLLFGLCDTDKFCKIASMFSFFFNHDTTTT